jgi:hypothetical protein
VDTIGRHDCGRREIKLYEGTMERFVRLEAWKEILDGRPFVQ